MKRSPDRLYELMPVVYRLHDAQQGYPLKALLRVINEQVDLVEADIAQLYENWFIETCEDWAVPYIADLVGYEVLSNAGEPADARSPRARERGRALIPRRDAAKVIRYRRSKGALALLELLARDTADLPARAVEFFKLLGWAQAANFPHLKRGRSVDLRDGHALDQLYGPFAAAGHIYDVRRAVSRYSPGRYNIPGIGLFAWRLKTYSVTESPAYCLEEVSPECYTFSALGHDTQLFNLPEPETDPTHIADELNLPVPISRRAFGGRYIEHDEMKYVEASADHYPRSLSVSLLDKKGELTPVPRESVIASDLSEWGAYRPRRGFIAVDPRLGRIVFPSSQKPKYGVMVSYRYAFSADIGGGEYSRPLSQPKGATVYRVGRRENLKTINQALKKWEKDKMKGEKKSAVVEIRDSGVYTEQLHIDLKAGESLQIRAANRRRPVIRLLDYMVGLPDAFGVRGENGSRFTLDGVIVSGRSIRINKADAPDELGYPASGGKLPTGPDYEGEDLYAPADDDDLADDHGYERDDLYETPDNEDSLYEPEEEAEENYESPDKADYEKPDECEKPDGGYGSGEYPPPPVSQDLCDVTIRHCTLVPGRSLYGNCEPRSSEPSLRLEYTRARINIEHSILGAVRVEADERASEPSTLQISDSILDATSERNVALGAVGGRLAYINLTIVRSTVIGKIMVHAMALAENTIFKGIVTVGRRLLGCVRFCYVTPGSRTPRRYECQPDVAERAIEPKVRDRLSKETPVPKKDQIEKAVEAAKESERLRVGPRLKSSRYGNPAYCQLAPDCAEEISRGADDESEMGAFHDLYQPQRGDNLRDRLDEFTPADTETAIIYVN
jgi:hypothetical protein